MIRIVHFSDWHSRLQRLPEADLYVCTGDMLPNTRACYWVDKAPEHYAQTKWIRENRDRYAEIFPVKAPLVIVRGNHDYVDLAPLFPESSEIHEFTEPRVIELLGVRIGGFRGVPPIAGVWADELSEGELAARCDALGPVDVLVTHGPGVDTRDAGYGSLAIKDYILAHRPKYHLFGHIHEASGQHVQDGTTYSNAAQGVEEIIIRG